MVEKLLKYQETDAKLREIEKTLLESEERKKAAIAKKYIEGVTDSVNKLDDRAAELLSAFEQATKEQIRLQEQESEIANALDESADEKAVAFLVKKAEELIGKIKALGDKASKIEKEIQDLYKEYQSIIKKTKAAQEQYNEFYPKYKELQNKFKEEKAGIEKDLDALKAKVDGALMERYLKKRNVDKIYPVIYEVRGGVCGNPRCNMELSAVEIDKLKKGEVIECGNCGRMIFQSK